MNELIGQHLGPYRILEQIGVGGMATVYKAYQPAMDRHVAVKVIAAHFAQEEMFLRRFRREARAVAKLEHAHILPVYDSGEAEGRPYLVMRYLEAGTLKDQMIRGPLPLTEVNHIIGQVGSALDYAHRMGVVHRDVKPSNVLLDAEGNTFLTDFGLAKMMEASAQLTGTGVGVGTPAYMSPEQGKGAKVDSRTDVYSLGVMLYEMVTGRAPYEAETPLAVVLKHIQEPLPLPRSVRPDLPEEVEQVILRAMAKEPDDRFQTAGEMVRALDAAVRASGAAARTEPAARVRPAVAKAATEPTAGVWTRAKENVQRLLPIGWGRTVMWVAVGIVALLALYLALSRVPLRVQINGGQLEVVRVVETTATSEIALATTPTEAVAAEATARPTSMPTAMPVPQPTPVSTSIPGPTEASSVAIPAAVAAPRWERVAEATNFQPVVITTLAVDPNVPDTIFAGTWGAGIYVSHDGGQTWTPSNEGLGKGTVGSIVVDPNDSNVVYTALFDQGGVYKSTDGGQTWTAMNRGIHLDNAGGTTGLIYLDPADSSHLYCSGIAAETYHSSDGGITWQQRGHESLYIKELAIDPDDSEHIYASAHGHPASPYPAGVYESHDGGQTWKRLTTDAMSTESDWWHLAADPKDFGILYAGGSGGVYRTSDGGQSWTPILDNRCRWLTVSEVALYCGQDDGMLISLDDGQSWSQVSHGAGGSGTEAKPFAIAPDDPYTLYAGVDAVAKSTDGGWTWTRIGRLDAAAHLHLMVDPRDGNRLFLSGDDFVSGVLRSEDEGETWQTIATYGGSRSRITIDPAQDIIYLPSGDDELYRSRDNGQTWERFGSGYVTGNPLQLVPDTWDSKRLWLISACGARLAFSEDSGETFEMVDSFPQNVCDATLLIHTDGRRMYVVDTAETYRSDDGGETWQSLGGLGGTYRAGVLDPSNPDVVYVGSTHKGVLKTENGGFTWQQVNIGLTNPSISELALDPANPQIIYAATGSGAFVSVNSGERWWPIQEGMGPNPIVYSIAIDPNDSSKVYAVTPDGIFGLVGAAPIGAVTTYACQPGERLLYSNDFEDGELSFGSWVAEEAPSGGLALHAVGEGMFNVLHESDPVAETRIAFQVRPVSDEEWVIHFRWREPPGDKYNLTGWTDRLELALHTRDSVFPLASADPLPPNRWASVEIVWEDRSTLVVQIDGAEVIRHMLPENSLLEKGGIHLDQPWGTSEAWFDDIVVCGEQVALSPLAETTPAPAGECRIAYYDQDDIYVRNCDDSDVRRLTDHPAWDVEPAFSPDGQHIVFQSDRDCEPAPDEETHCLSLYIVDVDGSNLTRLTNGDNNDVGPTWSPDGSHIAFHRDCDLAIINPDGSNLWLWQSDVCIENPAWSPDGQRLAFGGFFTSAFPDDQHRDIYIINSDGTNLVKLARFEAPGGVRTIWSPDGRKIGVQIDEHEKFGVHPYYLLNADGSGEPMEVESIPHSWYHWYWPQWDSGG